MRVPQFRLPSLTACITFIVVGVSAGLIFGMLQPGWVFTNTLPTGGDMGAHAWGPWFMKNHLFEHFRITGWTPDWYAGFPAFTFYFPLPAFVIAVLSFVLPYGVAFKLIAISGLVTLPISAWAFGKLARLPFPAPACLAAGMLVFVFDTGFNILGGNAMSTLAGEYSFSIGLSFAFVFLGFVAGGLETGKYRAWAAVFLACTVLSHILPTLFALTAGVIFLIVRLVERNGFRAFLRWALPVAIAGCLITGFWSIPFIFQSQYMNDMGWEKMGTGVLSGTKIHEESIVNYGDALLLKETQVRLALIGAVIGGVLSLIFRRRVGIFFIILALTLAGAFRFMPQSRLWNARILPFYYLTLYLMAALMIAEIGWGVAKWIRKKRGGVDIADGLQLAAPFMALTIALAMVVPALPAPGWWPFSNDRIWHQSDRGGGSMVNSWAKWNFEGYDGKNGNGTYRKPAYPEFASVLSMMDLVGKSRGCGRVMWEFESELDRFGTTMALQLLPMKTDGCMGSMEGLFFESSATVPYHFLTAAELSKAPSNPMRNMPYKALNVADGVTKLQLMGVKYYLAVSPDAQAQAADEPRLKQLASVPAAPTANASNRQWIAYEVTDANLVSPMQNVPNVVTKPQTIPDRRNPADVGKKLDHREAWLENQLHWWSDATNYDTPLAQSGPKTWPRIKNAAEPLVKNPLEPVQVSKITSGDDFISFHVDKVGVPVLIHTSYFPNWDAKGAKGPYRVSPNQMVVIPTKNDVRIHYGRTWVDWFGIFLSLVGIAMLWWLRKPDDSYAVASDASADGATEQSLAEKEDLAQEGALPTEPRAADETQSDETTRRDEVGTDGDVRSS